MQLEWSERDRPAHVGPCGKKFRVVPNVCGKSSVLFY